MPVSTLAIARVPLWRLQSPFRHHDMRKSHLPLLCPDRSHHDGTPYSPSAAQRRTISPWLLPTPSSLSTLTPLFPPFAMHSVAGGGHWTGSPTSVKVAVGGARPLPVSGATAWFPSPPATLGARAPGHQWSNLRHAPLLPRSMVVPAAPVAVPGGAARPPSPLASSHCWTIALEARSPLPYHLCFMVGLAEEVPSSTHTPLHLDLRRSTTVAGAHLGLGEARASSCTLTRALVVRGHAWPGAAGCPPLPLATWDPLLLCLAMSRRTLLEAKFAQRPRQEGYSLSARERS
jgi:hypothetical protein